MKKFITTVLILIVSEVTLHSEGTALKILDLIKDQSVWQPEGIPKRFDSKSLSSRRSREAQIFLEYGVSALTAQDFKHQGKSFTLEFYEMLDSVASFGVFTFFRDPDSHPLHGLGNEAEEGVLGITFQQNRYFIRLLSNEPSLGIRSSLQDVAHLISKALPVSFSPPMVISKLPEENRVARSEVFMMGHEALAHFLPMRSKDPFGLDIGCEAAMAKYQFQGDSAKVLLIHYPNQQLAKKYLENGYQEHAAEKPDQAVFFKRDGPLVVLVIESSSPELATVLLDKVNYVSTVSFDPKVHPLNIGQVMTNIFIFCGIMLGITFLAGILFGVIRIVMKRIFPGLVFDRSKDMDVIRLDLTRKK